MRVAKVKESQVRSNSKILEEQAECKTKAEEKLWRFKVDSMEKLRARDYIKAEVSRLKPRKHASHQYFPSLESDEVKRPTNISIDEQSVAFWPHT